MWIISSLDKSYVQTCCMNSYLETLIEQQKDHQRSRSIPAKVYEFLIKNLPKVMMCSSTLKSGDVRTYTLPKNIALTYEHIQINHENLSKFIVIDDDGLDPSNFLDLPVAPPNLVIVNPKTGHSQKWYFLQEGVTRTHHGSEKAKNYYSTTVFKLTAIYNGDPNYSGFLARNPLSKRHIVFSPHSEPYTLDQLNASIGVTSDDYDSQNRYKSDAFLLIADYCRRNRKLSEVSGIGRNCTIFEILRHQAYREWQEYPSEQAFANYLQSEAYKINKNRFANDLLPENELKHIANSIARYCFSNRIKKTGNPRPFLDRQKSRGSLGGKARSEQYDGAREKFTTLYTQNPNLKTKEFADLCGVSERTIRTYKKQVESKFPTISELKLSEKTLFEDEDIYQRPNKLLAKKFGVSVRTIQRRRSKSRTISAQAINRALLIEKEVRGDDKTESSHFSWLHEVSRLKKNENVLPLYIRCIILIPFRISPLLCRLCSCLCGHSKDLVDKERFR